MRRGFYGGHVGRGGERGEEEEVHEFDYFICPLTEDRVLLNRYRVLCRRAPRREKSRSRVSTEEELQRGSITRPL